MTTERMKKAITPNYEALNRVASVMPVEVLDHFKDKTLEFAEFCVNMAMESNGLTHEEAYDAFHYKGSFNDLKEEIMLELENDLKNEQ